MTTEESEKEEDTLMKCCVRRQGSQSGELGAAGDGVYHLRATMHYSTNRVC